MARDCIARDEARDGRNVALIEFIGVLDRPKKIPSTKEQDVCCIWSVSTFVTSCAIAAATPSTQDAAEAVGNPKMLRENLPSAIMSVRAYLCTMCVPNT